MGPLLFLIYVNDLPCASGFQSTLFADDTSLHLSHKYIKTLQLNVQNELDKVDTWTRSNRLSINYNKTACMILTATRYQNCNFKISMNGVRIQQTDSTPWRLGGFSDFRKKNSSFRLPYQRPSSSADCATELFNGSNGSASLVECTRKKIFAWGVRVFCE